MIFSNFNLTGSQGAGIPVLLGEAAAVTMVGHVTNYDDAVYEYLACMDVCVWCPWRPE